MDRLPLLDRQFDNLAAHLRADVDLDHRLNLAVGLHGFHQVSTGHFFGLNGDEDLPLAEDRRHRQAGYHQADDRKDNNFPAFFRGCHDNLP